MSRNSKPDNLDLLARFAQRSLGELHAYDEYLRTGIEPAGELSLATASTSEVAELPTVPCELGPDILCRFQPDPEFQRIRLNLAAQGFAGIEEYKGRRAFLSSDDGEIRIHFTFDELGRAELRLRDSSEIRRSLGRLALRLVA